MGGRHLNAPVVGIAACNPERLGTGSVASDGGIFAFGDARFTGRWATGTSSRRSSAWLVMG